MKEIKIKSAIYDYGVHFTNDFSYEIGRLGEKCTYVIDRNVYHLYKDRFALAENDKIMLIDAVEEKKTMETVMDILRFWQQLKVRKDWKILCFGGGITQDITTVAADLFLRNMNWYFFPTTLLSMCDSCIGGKCGINLGAYKNQIGVFYPPKEIIIDTSFIHTLSHDDYLNGWGEILKFALTNDPSFYDELKNENQYIPCDRIQEYIQKGLMVKKGIIEEDEFESDLRRVLNYGHTFGHALEAYTDHAIPHGKGVIWGIDVANYIAYKEDLISKEYYDEIKALIKTSFLNKEIIVADPDELFEIIKTDKKVRGNTLHMALLNGKSHLIVYPVEINNELKLLFKQYIKETHEYYSN